MKMKRMITVAAMASLVFVGACTKSCRGKKDEGVGAAGGAKKVFRYVRISEERSLDPQKQFDEASSDIVTNVYDTLLVYSYLKRPYQLENGLLESMPEKSPDGLSYVFRLRKGVKFVDDACFPDGKGREMTIDDVIYSLKRFADANVNVLSYVLMEGSIEGMETFREETKKAGKATDYSKLNISGLSKVDDYTMIVKLTKVNPLALYPFAMSQTSIVPREAVEKYGAEFERHPVGSGAFSVKENPRRGEMVLVRNPYYWDKYPTEGEESDKANGFLDAAGKQLPFVDEVRLPLIEETQPAILTFEKGQVDVVAIDKDNFGKFLKNTGGKIELQPDWAAKVNFYAMPGLSSEYLKFNMKDSLMGGYTPQKKALRQAFAYAMNTAGYIELLLNGRAAQLHSIVPHPINGSEWTNPTTYLDYNVEMAKQKLAEAGYPEGKGLPEIAVEYRSTATTVRQQWEYVRDNLAKAGIKATANFQTFSAWLQKTEKGNFQVSGAGWQADYPDAENFFQLLYGKNTPPGPNDGSFDNAEYNKLYEEIRYMENGPDRYAKFARMNEIIKEDAPVVILYNQMRVGLMTPWVRNFKRNAMYNPPLKYVDIDLDRQAKGM
jgi:oligopeptide transport system substrate-binding protein